MSIQIALHTLRQTTLTGARLGVLLCALLPASQALAQRPPPQVDMTIDKAQSQQVVDALIRELNENYVFPAQAKKMEQALRAHQKRGTYAEITSATKLAETLTAHMQQETKDKHLNLRYSERPLLEQAKDLKPTAEQQAAELAEMKTMNFGVERVERLPFNIGYLDLRGFAGAKIAAGTITATMTLLANTDALIIDLRKNGGGDPLTVAMIASYFLDEPTHLNDIYWRKGDRTEQVWTSAHVAGIHYGQKKDIYLLTSKFTFSAAEDLSYSLQNQKRVTIVGETTGGGAHPGDFMRLNAHFNVFIPNGRSINPISKSNWEGTGVTPEIKTSAEDALKTAHAAILKKFLAAEKNPGRSARLQARITTVEAENTVGTMAR